MSEQPTHEIDEYGNELHIDVDPIIPTGICVICSWEPPFVFVDPLEEHSEV